MPIKTNHIIVGYASSINLPISHPEDLALIAAAEG